MLVDSIGLILAVTVHTADIQDRDGAKRLLEAVRCRPSKLKRIWADGGYAVQLIEWVKNLCPRRRIVLEIVKRPDAAKVSRWCRTVGRWSGRSAGWGVAGV